MGVDSSYEVTRMRMRARYKKIRLFPLRLYGTEWPCGTESSEDLRTIITG